MRTKGNSRTLWFGLLLWFAVALQVSLFSAANKEQGKHWNEWDDAATAATATSGAVPSRATPDGLLFHLIHVNGNTYFPKTSMRVVESIFFHHPTARVKIHVPANNPMSPRVFQPLLKEGYSLSIEPYDLAQLVEDTVVNYPAMRDIAELWMESRIPQWRQGFLHYSDESDLVRLLILYNQGTCWWCVPFLKMANFCCLITLTKVAFT